MDSYTQPRTTREPDPSVLVHRVMTDIRVLVGREIRLFQTEMRQKAITVESATVRLVVGGSLLFAAALTSVAAAILVLWQVAGLSPWLASLLIVLVLAVSGGLTTVLAIRALRQVTLWPEQTIESLEEDVPWKT